MKPYYTDVSAIGDQVFYRGVNEKGKRITRKFNNYKPVLFIPSKKETSDWKSHLGIPLEPMKLDSIRAYRKFVKEYDGVDGFAIYGNISPQWQFIREYFPDEEIVFNRDQIVVANIDMEVNDTNGFPDAKLAKEPITSITLEVNNVWYVISTAFWEQSKSIHVDKDIRYTHAANEIELLEKFLEIWTSNYPDIVTGWNIRTFDIPYLIRRLGIVLTKTRAKLISPWGMISEQEVMFRQKMFPSYDITGIAQLDLLQMFQKFTTIVMENYKLDTVARELIGRGKMEYVGSLGECYVKAPQVYVDYNIEDAALVRDIDKSQGLIDLGLMIAYIGKVNYEDIFYPVRVWDVIIYNYLYQQKIAVPPKVDSPAEVYEGAFVKETQVGLFDEGLASFDAKAEYPSMMMMFNTSPETIVDKKIDLTMESLLAGDPIDGVDLNLFSVAANGYLFSKEKRGFIPALVERVFDLRNKYKKMSLDFEALYEKLKNEDDKIKASYYGTFEKALKVLANSFYGALANRYFRFFDIRIAEAITLSGQFCIRSVIRDLNKKLNKMFNSGNFDYIIASDTDSVYVNLAAFMNKAPDSIKNGDIATKIKFLDQVCVKVLSPLIDVTAENIRTYLGAYEQRFHMKREVLADRGLWTGKKHYVLNMWVKENVWYDKAKIKITGLEAIKSSTPKLLQKEIKRVIEIIMSGGTNEQVIEFMDAYKPEFMKLSVEQIASPRGINGVSTYGRDSNMKDNRFANHCPIHVHGALVYNYQRDLHKLTNLYREIRDGDKIKFIYLKEPNKFQSYVISFPDTLPTEFGMEDFIDYETQYNKVFFEPMAKMLKTIGWNSEIISTLDGFFD